MSQSLAYILSVSALDIHSPPLPLNLPTRLETALCLPCTFQTTIASLAALLLLLSSQSKVVFLLIVPWLTRNPPGRISSVRRATQMRPNPWWQWWLIESDFLQSFLESTHMKRAGKPGPVIHHPRQRLGKTRYGTRHSSIQSWFVGTCGAGESGYECGYERERRMGNVAQGHGLSLSFSENSPVGMIIG